MRDVKPVEIACAACGQDALLVRKPKYDGFKKVGEELSCAACGHVYASEQDVPFKGAPKLNVFSDADRPGKVAVFGETEASRLCRHCISYLVNPFKQWCSRHRKEVEATDSCPQFSPRPPEKPAAPDDRAQRPLL